MDTGSSRRASQRTLLLEELKRFNTVLKPKVDDLEKILAPLVANACRLFELKELADPVQNWRRLPKNPER